MNRRWRLTSGNNTVVSEGRKLGTDFFNDILYTVTGTARDTTLTFDMLSWVNALLYSTCTPAGNRSEAGRGHVHPRYRRSSVVEIAG
jgi:hypothetical protein